MSKPKQRITLSDDEIRAVYAEGEDAVVSLVRQLLDRLDALESRLETLEGRTKKTSRNSHKPPSGDGLGKRTKSLRTKSDKSSGGQPGHPGHTLEWSETVDWIDTHDVKTCSRCNESLRDVPVEQWFARQVFDIPAIELMVTEHRVAVKCCGGCGHQSQGNFPEEARTVVQYGSRLKAMMVYLMERQLLPSERICEIFRDLLGVNVSEGTLYTSRTYCYHQLDSMERGIQSTLVNSSKVHFDETGMRVNGQLWWLHVACTDGLTYYFVHPKRGTVAMNEMAILPEFKGKAVHDGWKSYAGYACDHFLCNAHHLRELRFILEHYDQWWAYQLSLLLVTILHQVQAAKANGQTALPDDQRKAFEARYADILAQGFAANPLATPSSDAPKKRGRPKRSPPRNLLERLKAQQASVLGFMVDFEVPFDNNQAERDLRMMKLKQKISGCFRSVDGARMFCRIRGYLSTLRKQGQNILDALMELFSSKPLTLIPQAK
ncbi:MAG: IS66 family transposase [Cyanobacteria bacterium P01_D01_bin.56]